MDFPLKKIDYRNPLSDEVYTSIKEAIIQGELAPGTWLQEDQLTQTLGISRTPLREAFNRLKSEDLIAIVPRKGAYIIELSTKELEDLFEAREVIETTFFVRSVEYLPKSYFSRLYNQFKEAEHQILAVENDPRVKENKRREYLEIDRSFHDRVIEASGNEYWIKLYCNIRDRIQIYGHKISYNADWFKVAQEDHKAICTALLEKEYEKARTAMQQHIRNMRTALTSR